MSYSSRLLAVAVALAVGSAALAPVAVAQSGMMSPSPAHKEMARDAGTWNAEMTLWMGPDAASMTSKGVETNTMFGDYWMESKFEGDVAGQKFAGRAMTGYDPVAKKFVGTWCDTMSPYMSIMEGDYDVETHTLTMMGKARDPASGEMTQSKLVTKFTDDNSKTMTMYSPKPGEEGKWWKMLEIKYTRAK